MKLQDQVLLITGANRGIGKALVRAALVLNIKKVYVAARQLDQLPDFADKRVVPIQLDITDPQSVAAAASVASDTQVLINNAGALAFAGIIDGEFDAIRRDMEVNYFGTLRVTRAFAPLIVAQGGGIIASISSIVGLASVPTLGGYSASKAALFSAIQGMRAELRAKNIKVIGVFPGPIDTDMTRDIDLPKTSVTETATQILAAIEDGQEDIFPDATSAQLGALWLSNPKALEQTFVNP